MTTDRATGQTQRLGALLAVLNRDGALLYLSPELQRLLGTAVPGERSTELRSEHFWSVVREPDPAIVIGHPRPTQLQVGPALVRLHLHGGRARMAHMNSTFLPEQQITLLGFLLEIGEQAGVQLSAEHFRQMLYQLPLAAVGVGLGGQLLYVNAQAVRNAEMIEGATQQFLGLNNAQYSELRGQDTSAAERRTQNLQLSLRERRPVSWIDQVQLPGQPPEYWRRSYNPVYNELGDVTMITGLGIEVTDDMHHTAELELLAYVAQNSGDAVLVVDLTEDIEDSRIIFANRVALRLLGAADRRPLTGRSLHDVATRLINDQQHAQLVRLLQTGRGTSGPVYYAEGTASERCLEISVVPGGLATTRGSHSHLCLTIRDVTETDRAGKLERGRGRALQLALAGAPLREVLAELVATLEGQLPGLTGAVMLLRGDHLFFGAMGDLPEGMTRQIEGRQVGPNQGPYALAVHLGEPLILADIQADPRFQGDWALARTFGMRSVWTLPFRGKQGQILGTFTVYGQRRRLPRPRQLELLRQLSDLAALLTESRQASDQLSRVAYHDGLTGLPNRPAFMQTLDGRLDQPNPGRLAVALLDLNGFRAINEAYGQAVGNRLLQQVAGRLQEEVEQVHFGWGNTSSANAGPECVERKDDQPMLARLGGDEFALLIPDLGHSDELVPLGNQLAQAISVPFQIEDQTVTLQASVGWSIYPDLAMDASTLLNQADTAMYTARQDGQFQRLYSQHGGDWSLSPTTLRVALETALDLNQLHLVYQPLIGRGGELRSFEALLRWTHPDYGQIGPDQFIPVAETSGMIRHIGLWVLEQATRTALAWPSEVLVSVNISGRQFERPGFAAEVAQILAQTGLEACRLELELTESALMTGDGQAARTLQELDDLGVRVALDDYGVGYSNLMRLHTLPISTIKLDRSFTRDLSSASPRERGTVRASASIIRSVVGLAHDLGLEVVAEGIETPEQLEAVLDLQCDSVQGYFYSRPLTAQAALEWLNQRD